MKKIRKKLFLVLTLLFSAAGLFPSVSAMEQKPGHRIDFRTARNEGSTVTGWIYKKKPGVPDSRFTIEKVDGKNVLCMRSNGSSGTLLYDIAGIDLEKYPYMRWKWRVDVFPVGGDGRYPSKDDQAIALYLGSGTPISQKTTAFRWDTLTPKGSRGFVKYALGMVKVNWICLRNKDDGKRKWLIEECNAREILAKMFSGHLPRQRVLTLSANSQYTSSSSLAYLEYIEFYAESMNNQKKEGGKK